MTGGRAERVSSERRCGGGVDADAERACGNGARHAGPPRTSPPSVPIGFGPRRARMCWLVAHLPYELDGAEVEVIVRVRREKQLIVDGAG